MDYLPENVHLLNITKWKLCASIVIPLTRLQKLKYCFRPLRSIYSSLQSAWKPFFLLQCYEGIDIGKIHYQISALQESAEKIDSHFNKSNKGHNGPSTTTTTTTISQQHPASPTANIANAKNSKPVSAQESIPRRKSAAYLRIKNLTESNEHPAQLQKSVSKLNVLKKMFSLKSFTAESGSEQRSDSDDSDPEDKNSENSGDDSENNETKSEEEAEKESNQSSSVSKAKRNVFKSILKKIW